MRTLYRLMPVLILSWLVVGWLTPIAAQEVIPAPVPMPISERPLIDINPKDLRDLGLGVLIFIVWYFDQRRQRSLEEIIKTYDGTQQAHLSAFKDINERNMGAFKVAMEASQKLSEDYKDTAVMCATVNTTVGAKLEQLVSLVKERHA